MVAANPAYSDAVTPQIEFDGSGLALNLDYLRSEAPDKFQSLQEMLQRVVPGVKKLGARRAKVAVAPQRLIQVDGKSISYQENQEMTEQEIILDMKSGDLFFRGKAIAPYPKNPNPVTAYYHLYYPSLHYSNLQLERQLIHQQVQTYQINLTL